MRAFLVGAMAALVAVGSPAFAGGNVEDIEPRAPHEPLPAVQPAPATIGESRAVGINEAPPYRDIVVEEYHSAGAELGMGIGATLMSLVYHPVRAAIGLVGAELGGFGGWATGGDLRTARSFWRPMVEGDYFIRPDHFDATEGFQFSNVRPVIRERYTIRGQDTLVREDTVAEAYMRGTSAPAVPHDEDAALADDSGQY